MSSFKKYTENISDKNEFYSSLSGKKLMIKNITMFGKSFV